jgi:hypothetical protein
MSVTTSATQSSSSSTGVGGAGGGPLTDLPIAATDATLALAFSATAEGSGTKVIGNIHLDGDVGTVEIHGKMLPAVVYEKQPFAPYVLYQTLIVDDAALYVSWVYCLNGKIDTVYYEGTDGTTIAEEPATGTCSDMAVATSVHVTLPAADVTAPALLPGWQLDGPDIHYDGVSPGTVNLGEELTLLPFGTVDCSQCGSGGWFELHSLLWDPTQKRLCFAIIYVFKPGTPLQMTYSLTLPDLSDPAGTTSLTATFVKP